MRTEVSDWLARLPPSLDRHRKTLRALVGASESDDRIRLLVVGCSIGRGAADELSDIDAYIGIAKNSWPAFLTDVERLVRKLGDVVDLYHTTLTQPGKAAHQLTFVQYTNGVPLDLVVAEAPVSRARPPDWIVLYDPDGRVKGEAKAELPTADQGRVWSQAAWTRLGACAKYLTRDSLWEALEMLHLARNDAWRLWAAGHRVADPQYGLTSVFDSPTTPLPPNIAGTVARLDRTEILTAERACADLLDLAWPRAISAVSNDDTVPPGLSDWVRRQLASLTV